MSMLYLDDVLCTQCGRVYEASKGCPSAGVPADTTWEAVPKDWHCPDCGARKASFESVELIYQRAYCVLTGY